MRPAPTHDPRLKAIRIGRRQGDYASLPQALGSDLEKPPEFWYVLYRLPNANRIEALILGYGTRRVRALNDIMMQPVPQKFAAAWIHFDESDRKPVAPGGGREFASRRADLKHIAFTYVGL